MNSFSSTPLKTSKLVFLLIVSAFFIALIILLWFSGRGQVAVMPSSYSVPVVDVMSIPLTQQYSERRIAVGQVEANQLSALGFDRGGKLVQALVDEGQRVEAGQLMAQLDDKRMGVNLSEINATLARVEADLRLAKLSENRVADLVSKKLESSQRLDEVREATAAASALVKEVQARKSTVKLELDKTRLYAPFTGVVISRVADIGTVVNASQPVFMLQQENQLQVRFALPSTDVQDYSIGQNVELFWGDVTLQAQVKAIGSQRHSRTRTVDVLFTLQNEHRLLKGDLVSLIQQKQVKQRGSWVPRTALISGVRGLWSLFVVENNAQGLSVLVSKLVEVHYTDEQKAYVSGALTQPAQVVVDGVHKLVPGQQVQIQNFMQQSHEAAL
ncbi:MAG: efflux RND transporter periplasmic adaptor subunit [Paraglaciecola sp.]|nr:efflux RND transporter periplasmic adaptor subunit [Paraglaciecola sp.]